LRLGDNPALHAAAATGAPVIPVFILDEQTAGEWSLGEASRWWLHHSLRALNETLQGRLLILRGSARNEIEALAAGNGAEAVYWNRCYEPSRIVADRELKSSLQQRGIKVRSFNGSLLFDPTIVAKADGTPYRVFTPFYRKGCLENAPPVGDPLPAPTELPLFNSAPGLTIDELQLLPKLHWADAFAGLWSPGEVGARERLSSFLAEGVAHYKEGRNRPDKENVSRLSPHLHFGEISPRQVWQATESRSKVTGFDENIDHFRSELGWREFSYYLLYHFPDIVDSNLQRKFDRFPWHDDEASLRRWQRGLTGYPIVDAGMRELWQTGYMHNRVRMIVGSFLVKNLLIDWRHGARWFWDTLLDADLANNSASWQWVAGSGADAAPYFRIFNPVTQGKKFDPDGSYVRKYIPELAKLANNWIHNPWEAPESELLHANIRLDHDYPRPIVELAKSRQRALAAFKSLA
jgi:deoxyribodipyrimidine photo-lyase